jgi:hypothetical protein
LLVAVVTLVQAPVFDLGQPHLAGLVEHDPEGLNCAAQNRRKGQVELQAALAEQFGGALRLGDPALGERHVRPTGETVLKVPGALAVAQQDQLGAHKRQSGSFP